VLLDEDARIALVPWTRQHDHELAPLRARYKLVGRRDRVEQEQPLAIVGAPEAKQALVVGEVVAGGGEVERAALGARACGSMAELQNQADGNHSNLESVFLELTREQIAAPTL